MTSSEGHIFEETVLTAIFKRVPFRQDITFFEIPCLFELIKDVDNQDRHKLSDKFDNWLRCTFFL